MCRMLTHSHIHSHILLLLEVVADDTPAVDAVLKADTKRLELLEEVIAYAEPTKNIFYIN